MRKFLLLLFIAFCHVYTYAAYKEVLLSPPLLMDCAEASPHQNQIVYGATPNGTNKPVLVFVHGFFDTGFGWFTLSNQMYANAYTEGYPTAFLMHPQNRPVSENGAIIAAMIQQVKAHYGVQKVILVVHSKGALDSEAAMYLHGADASVQNVISLSGAYQGAPFADIFDNPLIKGLLYNLPLVGPVLRQGGAPDLQPNYVRTVLRTQFDNHPLNDPKKYICLGGRGFTRTSTNIPYSVQNNLLSLGFYRLPLCDEAPVGNFYRGLMKWFFSFTGTVSRLIVENDPYKNLYVPNDGLAGFEGAMRPGCYQFMPLQDTRAFLNHFDFLYSNPTWYYLREILQKIETGTLDYPIHNFAASAPSSIIEGGINFVSNKQPYKHTILDPDDEIAFLPINADNINYENALSQNTSLQLPSGQQFAIIQAPSKATIAIQLPLQSDGYIDLQKNAQIELQSKYNQQLTEDHQFTIYLQKNMSLDGRYEQGNLMTYTINATNWQLPTTLSEGVYHITVVCNIQGQNVMMSNTLLLKNKLQNTISSTSLVYPNPTADLFTISGKYSTIASLQIFDVLGSIVYSKENINTPLTLSTVALGLSKGRYFIRIDGVTQSLIVQ